MRSKVLLFIISLILTSSLVAFSGDRRKLSLHLSVEEAWHNRQVNSPETFEEWWQTLPQQHQEDIKHYIVDCFINQACLSEAPSPEQTSDGIIWFIEQGAEIKDNFAHRLLCIPAVFCRVIIDKKIKISPKTFDECECCGETLWDTFLKKIAQRLYLAILDPTEKIALPEDAKILNYMLNNGRKSIVRLHDSKGFDYLQQSIRNTENAEAKRHLENLIAQIDRYAAECHFRNNIARKLNGNSFTDLIFKKND